MICGNMGVSKRKGMGTEKGIGDKCLRREGGGERLADPCGHLRGTGCYESRRLVEGWEDEVG